jgi:hypothetical protein
MEVETKMTSENEEALTKVNVSNALIADLRARHPEWSPKLPAVFVVDSALRLLKEYENKEKEEKAEAPPLEQRPA